MWTTREFRGWAVETPEILVDGPVRDGAGRASYGRVTSHNTAHRFLHRLWRKLSGPIAEERDQ